MEPGVHTSGRTLRQNGGWVFADHLSNPQKRSQARGRKGRWSETERRSGFLGPSCLPCRRWGKSYSRIGPSVLDAERMWSHSILTHIIGTFNLQNVKKQCEFQHLKEDTVNWQPYFMFKVCFYDLQDVTVLLKFDCSVWAEINVKEHLSPLSEFTSFWRRENVQSGAVVYILPFHGL